MQTLNHTLDQKVLDADGAYLNVQGLQLLESFCQTYTTRLEAYQQIRDRSKELVLTSLKKMAQAYPDLMQKHAQRCQYDMSEVLRYIALSILRDDETFFTEQMVSWLDTILLAHKRTSECAMAYRYLQEAINASLSPSTTTLIRPYLENVMQALQGHA